jgi:hypothetical protein
MLLLVIVPILFVLSLFTIIYNRLQRVGLYTRLRTAIIPTFLLTGLFIVIVTELLSAFSLLTFPILLVIWSVAMIAMVAFCVRKYNIPVLAKEIWNVITSAIRLHWFGWVILLFISISFLLAVLYPPNNYDSMTYHMARVAHWAQNHNISYYRTHIIRQLEYQPFAEWVILHLQILTGGDRFANAVQLFFYAGCISTVTLVAKELGANKRQQLLSALFTCLLPMAAIQSNTTQNDIVVAFFLLCFVFYTARLVKMQSLNLVFLAGIALGLSWLTKGTGYIFTGLFTAWYLIPLVKTYQLPLVQSLKKLVLFAIIPLLAIVINSGFFYRNHQLTGSFFGKESKNTMNQGMAVKPLILVGMKDILNNFPVNKKIKEDITIVASKVGLDANDPKYNFTTLFWMETGFRFHEDYMQNFVHTILILIACIYFLFKRSLYKQRPTYYTLFVFTLFGISLLWIILLKWQPWANRLETGLFILYCIFLAMEIGKVRKWLQVLCYLPMLLFALRALFDSQNHPIFPLKDSIFNKAYNSFIYSDAQLKLKDYLEDKPYNNLGIYIDHDSWDYPYYKLLKENKKRTLEHVLVTNLSSKYPQNFVPDAVISNYFDSSSISVNGKQFYKTKVFGDLGPAIYESK